MNQNWELIIIFGGAIATLLGVCVAYLRGISKKLENLIVSNAVMQQKVKTIEETEKDLKTYKNLTMQLVNLHNVNHQNAKIHV
jgi:hypothetical protein